jgi:hypothetical protein
VSATCRFCGQQFGNAQGVRAHLKACSAYKDRSAKALRQKLATRQSGLRSRPLGTGSPGIEPGENETSFDPVRQLQQRLAAERLRLQLREVEDAHAELDRRGATKERERIEAQEREFAREDAEARAKADAQRLATETAERNQRRAVAERERQERRRACIQQVKRQTVECWVPGIFVPPDVKSRMLKDIELELSALPVEDLPLAELVQIAEGIRDRHYRVIEVQQNQERERQSERQRLIRYGHDYASRELRKVEGLNSLDRLSIDGRVRRELDGIAGDETEDEIEGWVEDIFEDEGIEPDDDE